ncbi:hypothetical protein [Streptomyces sp. NPDC018833]|uniref:hypothetical protein n=1 Tax=Streptomyces sp. NPDC018833 TaxID=3365053 RepID=UPI0037B9B15C
MVPSSTNTGGTHPAHIFNQTSALWISAKVDIELVPVGKGQQAEVVGLFGTGLLPMHHLLAQLREQA